MKEPGISKVHACLKYKKNTWTLEDSNSTNGIWQNGKKQTSIILTNNVEVDLGSVELQARLIVPGKR